MQSTRGREDKAGNWIGGGKCGGQIEIPNFPPQTTAHIIPPPRYLVLHRMSPPPPYLVLHRMSPPPPYLVLHRMSPPPPAPSPMHVDCVRDRDDGMPAIRPIPAARVAAVHHLSAWNWVPVKAAPPPASRGRQRGLLHTVAPLVGDLKPAALFVGVHAEAVHLVVFPRALIRGAGGPEPVGALAVHHVRLPLAPVPRTVHLHELPVPASVTVREKPIVDVAIGEDVHALEMTRSVRQTSG